MQHKVKSKRNIRPPLSAAILAPPSPGLECGSIGAACRRPCLASPARHNGRAARQRRPPSAADWGHHNPALAPPSSRLPVGATAVRDRENVIAGLPSPWLSSSCPSSRACLAGSTPSAGRPASTRSRCSISGGARPRARRSTFLSSTASVSSVLEVARLASAREDR